MEQLPEKWYLKVTEENHDIVNYYRIHIAKYKDSNFLFNEYNVMYYDGSGGNINNKIELSKITTEQLNEYILSIREPIINQQPEDLSYLIDLFKQQQIT